MTSRISRFLAAIRHIAQKGLEREPSQASQVLLRMHYQSLAYNRSALPSFADVEFCWYSQNGEDGILLYLFSILGATNRRVVEICAGDGIECNAANLIVNHNWDGLLVDGSSALMAKAKAFYAGHRHTMLAPPTLACAWIDAKVVNSVVSSRGFGGDIDLLSLDLDGMDYWVWRAFDCVRPRVVVAEFNALLGPERRLTMPYDPGFSLDLTKPGPHKIGVSLAALVALAKTKGLRLVGVQSMGFNAFFVQDGLGEDLLPERSPVDCYRETPRLAVWNPGWLDMMFAGGQQWDEV